MLTALIIFAVTYAGLLALPKYRACIALAAGALFVVLGILPPADVLPAIDWNVLLMIAGTMGLVSLFIESNMPARLADLILRRVPNVKWAIVALSLFAGIISAFVDNVATVLMVAPVALSISRRYTINPVPMIIAIAVSSNLQGAATLVGDTTSILLGGYASLDFADFFFFLGKPGMFWVVELGAALTAAVLLLLFRTQTRKLEAGALTPVTDYLPTALLLAMVGLLITASFIPEKPAVTNGVICTGLLFVGLAAQVIRRRELSPIKTHLRQIDLTTLLLLMGLFVVISGITKAGVVDAISGFFVNVGGDSLFLIYTLVVWASVLFSAFIDNIPYTAAMLPVVQGIAQSLGVDPYVLYFGLLAGATLGGNLTPIGASANITAIGILRRQGCEVKTRDFMRIGVPFSLTAVISGYLAIWFLWS